MKLPFESQMSPVPTIPTTNKSFTTDQKRTTESTINGHWGYKTSIISQKGKARHISHTPPMHYSTRINRLAKTKLNEMLEIEKEMSYIETQTPSVYKRVQSASQQNNSFRVTKQRIRVQQKVSENSPSKITGSEETYSYLATPTNKDSDYQYSNMQLQQKLRLVGEKSGEQEVMKSFSMRKNTQNFWGSCSDPMHSVRSTVSPKEAAIRVFYNERRDTNPMLSNIRSRRSIKFANGSIPQQFNQTNSEMKDQELFRKNPISSNSIILNFQQEYLRHKSVVCQLNKLHYLYFDLDVNYHRIFGEIFGLDYLQGTNKMRSDQGCRMEPYDQKIQDVLEMMFNQQNERLLAQTQVLRDQFEAKMKQQLLERIKTIGNKQIATQSSVHERPVDKDEYEYDDESDQKEVVNLEPAKLFETFGDQEELAHKNEIEMNSFAMKQKAKDHILQNLQKQMQSFTDYAPFSFKSEAALATYFQISDVLTKVLQKKNSQILMETQEFQPTLVEVVNACKQFMQMLREDQFNQDHVGDESTPMRGGVMTAHLFECLMKSMLMIIDNVLEDRELHAVDLTKRSNKMIQNLEETAKKSLQNFETRIQDMKDRQQIQIESFEKRIQTLMAEKEDMAREVKEHRFQLNGLCSFERRAEEIKTIKVQIRGLESFLDDQEKTKVVQEDAIMSIMKMINVRGGCIPDYSTTSSQTEMSIPVFLPYIFTEIAGTKLLHINTSQMYLLSAMNREAARAEKDEVAAEEKNKKGHKIAPAKFNKETSLLETFQLFDRILKEKLQEDEQTRKENLDLYSLDEFTCLQFIKEHKTIKLASEHLAGHLKNMWLDKQHPQVQLISRLYGLNGFYKTKQDLVEYFIQKKYDLEKCDSLTSTTIFNQKQIYDHFKWVINVFGAVKTQKKTKNNMHEIGSLIFSFIWKYNTLDNCAKLGVQYVKPFIKLKQVQQHPVLQKFEWTEDHLVQLSFVLLSISIQISLERMEKKGMTMTLIKIIDEHSGNQGRIATSKLKEIFGWLTTPNPYRKSWPQVWIKDSDIDLICLMVDPTGQDDQGLHSYQALQDMIAKSDQLQRSICISNVQLELALLDALQLQIMKPIAQQITEKAKGKEKGGINYYNFDHFKSQVQLVKPDGFTERRYSNMFIRAQELILSKQADETFAFGQALVEECNKDQCLVGTFIDNTRPKRKGVRSLLGGDQYQVPDVASENDDQID